MRRTLIFCLTALAFITLGAAAQTPVEQPEEVLPGFKPDQVYSTSGIDNVNTFNGDPSIVVPLGSFPLGVDIAWEPKLYYSAKFWALPVIRNADWTYETGSAAVLGLGHVGVGWTFHLGYMAINGSVTPYSSPTYVGPDGGSHVFRDSGLRSPTGQILFVTTDGTHLRARCTGSGASSLWQVDFPDGKSQKFGENATSGYYSLPSAGPDFLVLPSWSSFQAVAVSPMTSMQDKFGRDVLTAQYSGSRKFQVTGVSLLNTDPEGSSTAVTFGWNEFFAVPPGPAHSATLYFPVLTDIWLPSASGSSNHVRLAYLPASFQRSTAFDTADVPMLSSVTLGYEAAAPQTSLTYSFGYDLREQTDGDDVSPGTLTSITLPTGGQVSYVYEPTAESVLTNCGNASETWPPPPLRGSVLPDDPVNATLVAFEDRSPAVVARTATDPTSGLSSTTTYARGQCGVLRYQNGKETVDESKMVRVVVVTTPTGNASPSNRSTKHIFHLSNAKGNGSGLELERRVYTSTDVSSTGTPVRSVVNCWQGDSDLTGTATACGYWDGSGPTRYPNINVRNQREVTWFGANPQGVGDCLDDATTPCSQVDRSDWDAAAAEFETEKTAVNFHANPLMPEADGSTWEVRKRYRVAATDWTPDTNNWLLKRPYSGSATDAYNQEGCPASNAPCTTGTTTYTYSVPGNLTKPAFVETATSSSSLGNVTRTYEPDAAGHPKKETAVAAWDPSNPSVTNRTFRKGQLLSSQVQGVSWKSFNVERDLGTGLITLSKDPNLLETSYTYDALGRLTGVHAPSETPRRYCYSPYTSVTSPAHVLALQTDSTSCPSSIVPSEGRGSAEAFQFDGFGRIRRHVKRFPNAFAWPGSYLAMQETRYDAVGNRVLVSEWTPCGQDADLTSCFDDAASTGESTVFSSFDPFGRPLVIKPPDGTSANYVRKKYEDHFGTEWTMTGGVKIGTALKWTSQGIRKDIFGRAYVVPEPDEWPTPTPANPDPAPTWGPVWSYSYNTLDKLTRVKVPSGYSDQNRGFTYNELGFLTSETHHERCASTPAVPACSSYTPTVYSNFDVQGNARQKTEGGVSFFYQFDAIGRPLTIRTGSASGTLYAQSFYDGAGFAGGTYPQGRLTRQVGFNPAAAFNASMTYDFTYSDPSGRLSAKTATLTLPPSSSLVTTETFAYNALGLLETHGHPRRTGESFSTATSYVSGFPTRIQASGANLVSGVTYSASGALATYTTGNAVTTTITPSPNKLPRPFSISTTGASDNFSSGTYGYDLAGNVTSIGADSFQYDVNGRLTKATYGAGAGAPFDQFAYDSFGNITSRLTEASTTPVSLLTELTNNHLKAGSYDAAGNLIDFTSGTGTEYYYYDQLSRQYRYGPVDYRYFFDAENERVATVTASFTRTPARPAAAEREVQPVDVWSITLRDPDKRLLTEYRWNSLANTSTFQKDYVYLGGALVATFGPSPISAAQPVGWYYYSSDHLGTPRLITDAAGLTVTGGKPKYRAFGLSLSNPISRGPAFAAMEREVANGNYYDHARFMGTFTGRFLSPDKLSGSPEDPMSWNRYTYARNNPLLYVDPDGRAWRPSTAANSAASVITGFLPIAGEIQDATIAFTGYDPVTSERMSSLDRVVSGAALLVPFVGGTSISKTLGNFLPAGRAIGFAPGEAISALTPDRLQHASRHLTDAGLLGNWSKKTGQEFTKLAANILENPRATVDATLRGGQAVKGFVGTVNGKRVIIFVFKDGANSGKVATAVVPSVKQALPPTP